MIDKTATKHQKKPDWLKIKLTEGGKYAEVKKTIENFNLNTICSDGKCPNRNECWSAGTATFMILGDICTRACKFCATKTGRPKAADYLEPLRVAQSIQLLNLKHAVITSVDRDDMEDGGSIIWAETIKQIKFLNPNTTIEVLIPDFRGQTNLIDRIINEKPNIISHNMETVNRLTKQVRRASKYETSLSVLKYIAQSGIKAKSGIMVGLGETESEVLETIDDLIKAGVSILTIGQYLQPTKNHLEVVEYIKPEQFFFYKAMGLQKGMKYIESGPLVRSSYHAERHI